LSSGGAQDAKVLGWEADPKGEQVPTFMLRAGQFLDCRLQMGTAAQSRTTADMAEAS